MGRRRSQRFAQFPADEDSAGEAPQLNPPGGCGGGDPSGEDAMRRGEAKEEERREETPPARRRVRGRPPKRAAPEKGKEAAAESPLEQRPEEAPATESVKQRLEKPPQTRLRPRRRRAPECQTEEEAPAAADLEQQRRRREVVVEHAVPIGEPVTITGRRGRNQRKHYASFEYNGLTFDLEDSVLITPEKSSQKPYAAIIKGITETEGNLTITGQWFYRPHEAEIEEGKFCIARDTRELFYSFHIDEVPAESVMHKCVVHFIPRNKKFPARKQHPAFIVQKVYGAIEKELWNLTDKEYGENRQQEINILLKKTIDRIGELPDLEPLRNKDVNPVDVTGEPSAGKPKNCEKAEALAISKLKNYAILFRYKALTGQKSRDRWLDRLLESIPLAWSKEITARNLRADPGDATKGSSNLSSEKIIDSNDKEKSYGLNDVVPIIVALERSAHEAIGITDSGKYNQKLRHLWYNIKNSSKLRRRLMEKELDARVLLTMSPDELKLAGLTSAEKTSEPEQPRQLQMTGARCERCQEKKVGISDIIQAGHRNRYQLECTSCSHTWFLSYDAISSLSAEGPCTATVINWEHGRPQAAAAREEPQQTS